MNIIPIRDVNQLYTPWIISLIVRQYSNGRACEYPLFCCHQVFCRLTINPNKATSAAFYIHFVPVVLVRGKLEVALLGEASH